MFNNSRAPQGMVGARGMQQLPQTLQPPQMQQPFDWQGMLQPQPMQPQAPQLPGVGQMRGWQERQQQDPQNAKRMMLADMLSGMGR